MLLQILFLQITLVYTLNITETTNKIAYLLNSYKNHRYPRCTNIKLNNFIQRTVAVAKKTENFGEYLKFVNVSSCGEDSEYGESHKQSHILNSLLISDNVSDSHWDEYKTIYKKKYSSRCREKAALAKWRENLNRVVQHNQEYLSGKHSYSLHLNLFGDLNVKDYFKKILKLFDTGPLFDPAEDHHKTAFRKNLHRTVPRSVDWRTKGFKPRLEEQWQCGACYAFAITHALQAQLYKRHGDWGELSPQQIVDCSYKDGNHGCDGGSLRGGLRYVAREGLLTEKSYPYTGKKGTCLYSRLLPRTRPQRWAMLPSGDEDAIEKAIATIGPLPVGVNAEPFTFQLYRSGIYDDPFCTPWTLNHAMLLVGYTPHYWILLNWWGKNWGEDGYIRIRRGFNRCGIANMAAYIEL